MTPPGTVRVALADDDDLVRAGVTSILQVDASIEVVVQARDGADLVEQVLATRADVILLDVRMPGSGGLTALDELRRLGIQTPVAMLTTFNDGTLIRAAIVGGAQGFLLKTESPRDLIQHIHTLAGGGVALSPRAAAWLLRSGAVDELRAQQEAEGRAAQLTGRQRDILLHLSDGSTNAEIARREHLSEGTVKQYVSAILAQLEVDNRVQAALIGHRLRTQA